MMMLLSLILLLLIVGFKASTISESSDDSESEDLDLNKVFQYVEHHGQLINVNKIEGLGMTALKSIERCDKENIFLLMEMKFDLFSTGVWAKAIKKDSYMGIKYLLKHYLRKKEQRRRALSDSVKYGAELIFYHTLKNYKDRVKPESEKKQALLVKSACKRKRYWMLYHLANEGFNANFANKFRQGRSLLHDAVISGDLDLVNSLLRFRDLNLDAADDMGNTPLHYASNMKIFRVLMGHGADPFVKNSHDVNPLFSAHPSLTSRLKLFQIYFSRESSLEDSRWEAIDLVLQRLIVPSNRETAPLEGVSQFQRISSGFTGPVEVYREIGIILAKALLLKVPIKFKLLPSLIKMIFGKTLQLEDLKDDDPIMYDGLLKVLESDFDFEDAVNVHEHLNKVAVDHMYTRHKEQIDELVSGFHSTISKETITAFFTSSEFQKIMFDSEKIDRYEIYRKFEFCRNYQIDNVEMFWAAMDLLSEKELLRFEQLITSEECFPVPGRDSLNLPISINNIEEFVEIIRKRL